MKKAQIKVLSYTLAAGVLLGSSAFTAGAAPLAGASSISSVADKTSTYTTFAGVNLLTANMLTQANSQAEASVAENAAAVVAAGTPVSEFANIAVAQVTDFVNVRSTPSEDGEILGKLYNNCAATINATEGDWYQITSGSVTGYVKAEFVVAGNEELAKSVSRKEATVHADVLYIRSDANTEASILSSASNNTVLTVTDDSMQAQGWVKVAYSKGEGFVSADYVTVETKFNYAESKAEEEARLAREEAERQAAAEAEAKKAARAQERAAAQAAAAEAAARSYVAPTGGDGASVVNYATQFVGNPYVAGGTSLTNGADCSGFVMSVYAAYGVSLPHSSSALRSVGYGVSEADMQPGDIVCYSGHVGIYAGNGQIVHASNRRTGITVSSAYYKNILAVRRIF